jgi:hypothetical protein
VTGAGALAYVFWHWPRASVAGTRYEADQRAFHAALATRPPAGFSHSSSSMLSGALWANGGREAYQDRYFIRSSAALDALDRGVASGPRRQAHQSAARAAAGGTAGLYRARLGTPPVAPRRALWFSKPAGVTYDELVAMLHPLVRQDESVLWMRRLVLGPSPEFCLETAVPVAPTLPFPALEVAFHGQVWPCVLPRSCPSLFRRGR